MVRFISFIIFAFLSVTATTPVIDIRNHKKFQTHFHNCYKPIALYVYSVYDKPYRPSDMSLYKIFEDCAEKYAHEIQFLAINRDYRPDNKKSLYRMLRLDRRTLETDDARSQILLYGPSKKGTIRELNYTLLTLDKDMLPICLQDLIEDQKMCD
jgi:hypothetical protein